jgi:hypothetical protein
MTEPQWAVDEIKAIQAGGIDWFGAPLKVDGDLGARTRWWLGMTSIDPLRQAATKLVLKYHHDKMGEVHGNDIGNDGTFVEMLLRPRKMKLQPWCIALASHIYQTVGIDWPEYHVSTWGCIEWAKKQGLIVTDPLPMDLECFLYPKIAGKDRQGHGRLILAFDPITKDTVGVDGNVGDKVTCGRRRDRPDRYFIRPRGLGTQHKNLTYPTGMLYLDNIGDR